MVRTKMAKTSQLHEQLSEINGPVAGDDYIKIARRGISDC